MDDMHARKREKETVEKKESNGVGVGLAALAAALKIARFGVCIER